MKASGHTAKKHLCEWWGVLENASLSADMTILGLFRATSIPAAKAPWTRYSASPPTSSQSPHLSFSSLSFLLFSPGPPFLSCLDHHHFSSGPLRQSPNWWLCCKACPFHCYFHFYERDLLKAPNSQCLETCYCSSLLKAKALTSVCIRITWRACEN